MIERSWKTPKFGVCIWPTANCDPPKFSSRVWCWHKPAEYMATLKLLNKSMHTYGIKFSIQKWLRRSDRHQSWGCAFNEQPTTAPPNMPQVCDLGISLLIYIFKGSTHTHGTKFSRQKCWRGTDQHQSCGCARAFVGQPTTALPNMPLVCDLGISLLSMR